MKSTSHRVLTQFLRGQLFATTALISISMVPGLARADMRLDFGAVTNNRWDFNGAIWRPETNPQAGPLSALPGNETGVISFNGGPRQLNIPTLGRRELAGLRFAQGSQFTLSGGTLVGGGQDGRLTLESTQLGSLLFIRSDIEGDIAVSGAGQVSVEGDSEGAITNAGDLIMLGSHEGNVVNNRFLSLRGDVRGDVRNNAPPDRRGALNLRGNIDGRLTNAGQLNLPGNSRARDLTNTSSGVINLQNNNTLQVTNTVQNAGTLDFNGGTLVGNVTNSGTISGSGTLRGQGSAIGEVTNTGTITTGRNNTSGSALAFNRLINNANGTVTVRQGDRLTAANGTQNSGTLNVNGTMSSGVANAASGRVVMGASGQINGAVTNAGTMQIRGQIGGQLNNSGSVTTAGDVRVTDLRTQTGGTTTIGANHTLSTGSEVQNSGTTNIDGTLRGNLRNNAGTTNLRGGTVQGNVVNDAVLNGNGTITGTLDNNATLNLTGNLRVGTLDNGGTATVNTGQALTADQSIQNTGNMTVAGNVNITGSTGLQNTGQLTLNGGRIGGNVTNRNNMLVNRSSQVTGDLTNTANLTLNGDNGLVTLNVGGVFSNTGTVDGTSANGAPSGLTISAGQVTLESTGTVTNVNVIGRLLNRAQTNYTQDSTIQGDLTNDTVGVINISANLDMTGHDLDNRGNITVQTGAAGTPGTLSNVRDLSNSGNITINAGNAATAQSVSNQGGGTITVAGTLNSGSAVANAGTLLVSGNVAAGLNNTGETQLTGGTLGGDVTNAGRISGNGAVSGNLANSGTLDMAGAIAGTLTNTGTVNQSGALSMAGLVNDEVYNVGSGGVLTSTAAVQNNDRLNIAGQVAGAVQNNASGQVDLRGGVIAGAVSNAGRMTGAGRIDGALSNSGNATLGGTLAGGVVNSGDLTSDGTLVTASLSNSGQVNVAAGSTLQSNTTVANAAQLTVAGRLSGAVDNTGTTTLASGTIAGAFANSGTLTGTGTIDGTVLNNAGATATFGGRVTGAVTNAGSLTSAGTLSVASLTNDEVLDVAAGSTLQSDGAIVNNDRATIAGRVRGTLQNVGQTTLSGGTVEGTVQNSGTLGGSGRIDRLENTGRVDVQGDLRLGALDNDEIVAVASGATLTSDSAVINRDRLELAGRLLGGLDNRGTTTLQGGVVQGNAVNAGTLAGAGTITGQLRNTGDLNVTGAMVLGSLTNTGRTDVGEDGVLRSDAAVDNGGALQLAGRLETDLVNRATATTTLAGGTVRGGVSNLGTLTGQGTVTGVLDNQGNAQIGGRVDQLGNRANGTLGVAGTLTATQFQNSGLATIGAGQTLVMADPDGAGSAAPNAAQNFAGGTLAVDGRLQGALANAGTLRGSGTITGDMANRGNAVWGGTVNGRVFNDAGRFTTTGTARVTAGLRNAADAELRVGAGSTLISNMVLNQTGGRLYVDGVLDGTVDTSGRTELTGRVSGNVIYRGGQLVTHAGSAIGRDLVLASDYAVAAGQQVTAGRTIVTAGRNLALQGQLNGALINQSRVNVTGQDARVTGNLENDGTVSMVDNRSDDVLTTGGLSGKGVYALDLDLRNMTADKIVVRGGAATGDMYLRFSRNADVLPRTGTRLTLIDVDEAFGSANNFTYAHDELPAASERIVYSLERVNGNGNLDLVSQLNPAMGAIFGNVALVQSLIGSVVNRPTSPFVTSLAYEDKTQPCSVGSWGRAIGGHATASGNTDNGISKVNSEVNADYYGMQVGTDLACFDNRFDGWNMAFGVLAGINHGSTSQPVYAINPNNSQDLTGILTSYTSTDFDQRYVGLYATATRDRFQADLQYRLERTDFTIANKAQPGYKGLGLDETDFSSDAQTLSGSISYAFPVGESGWAVLPTMGFAWSKLSTDKLHFDDGYTLTFKDSTRKVGFVGTTVAKTFVQPAQNSAIYAFATGTWYKDFADPMISVFAPDSGNEFDPQVLKTDNLGSFGEVSIGANWVKVLGPKSRGRQLSTGARIDARFGDQLDSVGVSGQIRWQF